MIDLLITENRSKDPVRFARNRTRVFLSKGYSYGLWVYEDRLFGLLNLEQKRDYLLEPPGKTLTLRISLETARKLVRVGCTISEKTAMLRHLEQVER